MLLVKVKKFGTLYPKKNTHVLAKPQATTVICYSTNRTEGRVKNLHDLLLT